MEQIDEGASGCCWLWERDRVCSWSESDRRGLLIVSWRLSQLCWMSKDSDSWNGNPSGYRGELLLMDPVRLEVQGL